MAIIDIKVPDIGDFKDVAVIELLVKPGDTVKPEQSLMTVESDKASMEIPSSHAGVVRELKVKVGHPDDRRRGCGGNSFSSGAATTPTLPRRGR
jgi:dihydrolipoamide dehydrogenase